MDLARRLDADHAVDVERRHARVLVDGLTGGDGADLGHECAGAGPSAASLLRLVRRLDQYAQTGPFDRPVAWDLDHVCAKEMAVAGSNASVPSVWDGALRPLAEGTVRAAPLVTGSFPLHAWRAAFDRFAACDRVKLVLDPGR